MENGILVGLSMQSALRRDLDHVAHNLANVNTTGFRRARTQFQAYVPEAPMAGPRADRPVFVRDVATLTDTRPGRLETTGNPLDLALRGDGFFVVATDDGPRYSRDGHFRLDETGRIVTEAGDAVLSADGQPLLVPSGTGTITIGRDGTVSADAGPLGRIGVVRFDDPAGLRRTGAGTWAADTSPVPVEVPEIVSGALERSNVDPILEITRMIQVHRAYQQARNVVDKEHERIRSMIEVYRA